MIGCKEEMWEVTLHEYWGIFNVIDCDEEMREATTRVLGVFNVIDCKEEMLEVASHEFWGYLM